MIKECLDAYAAASVRQFTTDRLQTVGASEVGQCARKTYFMKSEGDSTYGVPRDEGYVDGWGARMRGTIYENCFWEPALRAAYGDRLKLAGAEQQTFTQGFLSATPDGMIDGLEPNTLAHLGVPNIGAACIMVECKTADPRTNLAVAKPEHVFQAQVQLGLVRELTAYKPDYSLLTYTDASFWNEVREFPIRFDPMVYETAKARASHIMLAMAPTELRPEGWIAGGHECKYCPFTKPCGAMRVAVPAAAAEPPDPQFIAEVADLAREIMALEERGEELTAELRDAQNALRERLRAKGQRKVTGDGISVTWSAVKGRVSFDSKAIREAAEAAGIDISQFETVGEPTDRLVIKPLEQSRSAA